MPEQDFSTVLRNISFWYYLRLIIFLACRIIAVENSIDIDGELARAERKVRLRPTDLIWIMPT